MKVYAVGTYIPNSMGEVRKEFGGCFETLEEAFIEMYSRALDGEQVWTLETDFETGAVKHIRLADKEYGSYWHYAKNYWKTTKYNDHYNKKVDALRYDDI